MLDVFIQQALGALPEWAAEDLDAMVHPLPNDFLMLRHPDRLPMVWDCLAGEPKWKPVDMREWNDLYQMPSQAFLRELRHGPPEPGEKPSREEAMAEAEAVRRHQVRYWRGRA